MATFEETDMDNTEAKTKAAIQAIPLPIRLKAAGDMIGKMCAESRPPRMTIPPRMSDEDVYISQTLQDAAEFVRGETLRDRFAMAALQGMLHNYTVVGDDPSAARIARSTAGAAYIYADAMMEARGEGVKE